MLGRFQHELSPSVSYYYFVFSKNIIIKEWRLSVILPRSLSCTVECPFLLNGPLHGQYYCLSIIEQQNGNKYIEVSIILNEYYCQITLFFPKNGDISLLKIMIFYFETQYKNKYRTKQNKKNDIKTVTCRQHLLWVGSSQELRYNNAEYSHYTLNNYIKGVLIEIKQV